MLDAEKSKCEVCGGPHQTSAHFKWVEKPEGMTKEEITAELKTYAKPLKAMQEGGMAAAEKALNEMNLRMNGETCFCGTPNHTSADHLRWLADKQSEQ